MLYICIISIRIQPMITTFDILHFASLHEQFTKKELIDHLRKSNQQVSTGSISIQLRRLINNNRLIRLERGVFALSKSVKRHFLIQPSSELKAINQQIKTDFPFTDFCMWSSSAILPFMHHIPNINNIYVDVEREAIESVFNLLNNNNTRVFMMPSVTDFNRYINGNQAIIIRPLISEAPLQIIDGIKVPSIEKILVDIIEDIEFSFLQGAELHSVYSAIFEQYNVNKNKLFRYATRRNRKQEVEQLLEANNL